LTWILLIGVLDVLTYYTKDKLAAVMWPRVLTFCVFARGFVDLVSWFFVHFDVATDEVLIL
jgi:hypothetical protein